MAKLLHIVLYDDVVESLKRWLSQLRASIMYEMPADRRGMVL
jgi:hypothetical protein